MSPTKQAKPMVTKVEKGASKHWQGTKTPSGGRMEKKNLGEPRFSQGASSPLANEQTVYDYDSGGIIGQISDWFGTIRVLSSSIWLK